MPVGVSTTRYAQAVFQLAVDHDELDHWLDDLTQLADAVTDEGLRQILAAPRVPFTQKERLIRQAFESSLGPLAVNLMLLLASRNLVHILPGVVDKYQEMLDAHRGIERADVISAVPLNDSQRQKVSETLSNLSGSEISLTTRVDASILGGMIIRIGDDVIDGSTRTRLQTMRRELARRQ